MIRRKYLTGAGVLGAGVVALLGADPTWWGSSGVNITGTASNSSTANIGQLKNMAHHLHVELESILPGGAGFRRNEMFPDAPDPASDAWKAEQYRVANLGQLKFVASHFYERLNILAPDWVAAQLDKSYDPNVTDPWTHEVPWDPDTPIEENYKVANLGQLKFVFSLRVAENTDGDNIPDLQEHILYGSISGDGSDTDYDGDGVYDEDELVSTGVNDPITSPYEADTDGDGLMDGDDPNPTTAENDGSTTGVTTLQVLTPLHP